MVPLISLLKPGSILKDSSGRILDARSSVTLISDSSRNMIVDTGLAGEETIILDCLGDRGLNAEDIDIVINTHSHHDHNGNNGIFTEALLISPDNGDQIIPGVRALKTPGHTIDSLSVVVEARKTVVIAGDALPTFSNYLKGVPPAQHVDRNLACMSMNRILKIADVVIPGHDLPFSVPKKAYVSQLD